MLQQLGRNSHLGMNDVVNQRVIDGILQRISFGCLRQISMQFRIDNKRIADKRFFREDTVKGMDFQVF